MDVKIRRYSKYADCIVSYGSAAIEAGPLNQSERDELAASFRSAADELADDGGYDALQSSHRELLAALKDMYRMCNMLPDSVWYRKNAAEAIRKAEALGGEE